MSKALVASIIAVLLGIIYRRYRPYFISAFFGVFLLIAVLFSKRGDKNE